jgi:hypothetical protein
MAIRIRTEHMAGNHYEVERLALHVTRVAHSSGRDLPDELALLLQQAFAHSYRRVMAAD